MVNVAALGLRQALAKANGSRTVQEGLYRAYTAHLCDLDSIDEMPQALRAVIHELVVGSPLRLRLRQNDGREDRGVHTRAATRRATASAS